MINASNGVLNDLQDLRERISRCVHGGRSLSVGTIDLEALHLAIVALTEFQQVKKERDSLKLQLDDLKADFEPYFNVDPLPRKRCQYFDSELKMQCCVEEGHGPRPVTIRMGNEIMKDGHEFSPDYPPEKHQ